MGIVALKPKFLRALPIPANTATSIGGLSAITFKLIYEFWGFCVNGGTSLSKPGGFATSQVTGSYLNLPAGFESGSLVLVASGSDGFTNLGMSVFNTVGSNSFDPTVVGKYLVCWKSGSTSTDDSIYQINQWLGSSSVGVGTDSGGTTFTTTGSRPVLTTRSSINWRVVDLTACQNLAGFVNGNHMVLQFNGANTVNPGQAASQAQVIMRPEGGDPGGSGITCFNVRLSPSGSWDGNSVFVNESYSEFTADGTRSGPGGGGHSPTWFTYIDHATAGTVTMMGDNTFMHLFIGGEWVNGFGGAGGSSILSIEIPQRLYPQANDPNLICAANMGNVGMSIAAQVGYNYSSRYFPSPYDTLMRRWPLLSRCFTGSYWLPAVWTSSLQRANTERWSMNFNPILKKFMLTDAVIGMTSVNSQASAVGQFCFARARLRSCRFSPGGYPYLARAGDNGDRWIHAGNGIWWPWDHASIPVNIFMGV